MNSHASLLEYAILRAILLGNTYGQTIRPVLGESLGRKVSVGGIYTTLHRMEKKKWVLGAWGNDQAQGARRRHYSLTKSGEDIYQKMQEVLKTLL